MFERFTDRSRKMMALTNKAAQRFNHEHIGTEHILLGLIKEGTGVGITVLKNLDIDPMKLRLEVEKLLRPGPDMVTMGKLPQTPGAKKVIELAILECREMNHNYVGTEHILLGLLREDEGIAAQVLMAQGLKLGDVRQEVLNLLGAGVDDGPAALGMRMSRSPTPSLPPEESLLEQKSAEAGVDHQLGSLSDDVDYLQYLVSEFTRYYQQRQIKNLEKFEPPICPGVPELEEKIKQLNRDKDEAIREPNYELAAGLRDKVNELLDRKTQLYKSWYEQQKTQTSSSITLESVPLDHFSQAHLLLFRAGSAAEKLELEQACRLVKESCAGIDRLITERIAGAIDELLERFNFIGESIDEDTVRKLIYDLEQLKSDKSWSIDEKALRFCQLQQEIMQLIRAKPQVVCKVNVFAHGVRDVIDIEADWTIAQLEEILKKKYASRIREYLFVIHNKRIPAKKVRIRFFKDKTDGDKACEEMDKAFRLIDIPDRDTDGILWYPEWNEADEAVYHQGAE